MRPTWRVGQEVVHVISGEEHARGVVESVGTYYSAVALGRRWKRDGWPWGGRVDGCLEDADRWDREAPRRQQYAAERAEREARLAAELAHKREARALADRVQRLDAGALVELAAWLDAREVTP